MAQIFSGRYTAQVDEPFVVFLIGMRVNQWLAFRKWFATFRAMGSMLRTLARHPEKGFLGWHIWVSWRQIMLVQYWKSFEHLEQFARNRTDPHLAAWQRFNQTIGSDGSVGFWHETYMVEPGRCEAIYGNMPIVGLAAATKHVQAVGRRETARRRLGGHNEPAVPSPLTPLAG